MKIKLSARVSCRLNSNAYNEDQVVDVNAERDMSAFAGMPLSELTAQDLVGVRERFRSMIDQLNRDVENELALLQEQAYQRERAALDSTRDDMAL